MNPNVNPNANDGDQPSDQQQPIAANPWVSPQDAVSSEPESTPSVTGPSVSVAPMGQTVQQAQENSNPTPQVSDGQSGGGKKKKLLILAVAGAVLLFGGSAAAYFGVVVPNKPENLWQRALNNTAAGYDKLVDESKQQKEIKGAKVDGTFKFESAGLVSDGSFNSKIYENNSTSNIDIGASGTRVSFQVLTNVPANNTNPDIYLKAQGLTGIAQLMGAASPELNDYLKDLDNQWYVIDHTLLDQMDGQGANSSAPQLSNDDIIAIEEAVGRVNRDYLFTNNPEKAVLRVAENVGKEERDGRSVYRYKVGYNKEQLKKYVTALRDELQKTKLNDVYKDELKSDSAGFTEMLKSIDKLDGQDTADVWVDTKTKLIRTVRFTDKEKKDNYLDISLNYNGGDEMPFVIALRTKENETETNGSLSITVNTKKDDAKLALNFDSKVGGQTMKGKLDATVVPSDEKVEFKKPENVKSLTDLIGGFFGGPGSSADNDLSRRCAQAEENRANNNGRGQLPAECESLNGSLDVLGAFSQRF